LLFSNGLQYENTDEKGDGVWAIILTTDEI